MDASGMAPQLWSVAITGGLLLCLWLQGAIGTSIQLPEVMGASVTVVLGMVAISRRQRVQLEQQQTAQATKAAADKRRENLGLAPTATEARCHEEEAPLAAAMAGRPIFTVAAATVVSMQDEGVTGSKADPFSHKGTTLLWSQPGHTPYRGALGLGAPMRSGRHCARFEVLANGCWGMYLGVGQSTVDAASEIMWDSAKFWGVGNDGYCWNGGGYYEWAGQDCYEAGDTIELHLDIGAGTLDVSKNGLRIGQMLPGAKGKDGAIEGQPPAPLTSARLYWAVSFGEDSAGSKYAVRFKALPTPDKLGQPAVDCTLPAEINS